MKKLFSIVTMMNVLWMVSLVEAEVVRTLVKKDIELKPGQTFVYELDLDERAEISWRTTQEQKCEDNCVRATRMLDNGSSHYMETQYGGGQLYEPEQGKIRIEYKNVGKIDVVIDLFSSQRSCDAEACAILKEHGVSDLLYFNNYTEVEYKQLRVETFQSVEHSADQSYAHVKGKNIFGDDFEVTMVFWLLDKEFDGMCIGNIEKYFKQPREGWGPYYISGSVLLGSSPSVMKVEGCTPKGRLSERTPYDI